MAKQKDAFLSFSIFKKVGETKFSHTKRRVVFPYLHPEDRKADHGFGLWEERREERDDGDDVALAGERKTPPWRK
jgi:hypothetical protein